MAEVRGAMTCGEFTATPSWARPLEYEVTCRQLPGWSQSIVANEAAASEAIIRLQAEYRGSWAAEEKKR